MGGLLGVFIIVMIMPIYLWLTDHSTKLGKLRREIESIHQTLTRDDKDEEDRED